MRSASHRPHEIRPPRRMTAGLLAVLAVVLPALCAGSGATTLPAGEELMARVIEATGGRTALQKLHSRVIEGRMEMPAMGISASLKSYAAAPAKMYTLIESEALGRIETGGNGDVFWENMLMTGARILEGEERAATLREATFHNLLLWKELYSSVETMGVDTLNGEPCYEALFTPKEGQPEIRLYDVASYQLRKAKTTLNTQMGTITIEIYPSDYERIDGVLVPRKVKQILAGVQEMVVTSEKVTHNVDIPDSLFELPDEIRALMKE